MISKIGVFVTTFFILAGLVLAGCVDTDAHLAVDKQAFTKATVSFSGLGANVQDQVFVDDCKDSHTLIERTCSGDKEIYCEFGCDQGDGRCLSGGNTLQGGFVTQCFDSDAIGNANPTSQEDIHTKGIVSVGEQRKVDNCMDKNNLWEYDCSGGRKVFCEFGCEDGICRVIPQNQYDIVQTGKVVDETHAINKKLSAEVILLLILLGAIIAIIYSLRRMFRLEVQIKQMDIKIEKLLRHLLKKR